MVSPHRLAHLGSLAFVVACATAVGALAGGPRVQAAPAAAPKWLTWNAKTHTATLIVIAGYNNALKGYNFDGYGNGKMIVTVPLGAHVNVTFSNNSDALNHAFQVTPYADLKRTSNIPVAFKGAVSTNTSFGIAKGKTEHLSFVASKLGKYAMICPVPSHEPAGMWDVLMVVKGGAAKLTLK